MVDAIVFIIDSFDRDRFAESKEELDVCLNTLLFSLSLMCCIECVRLSLAEPAY